MNDKTILARLKLFIPAASASATPPLGPILGQYGLNTVQFCKEFNEKTYEFSFFLDSGAPFMLNVDVILYDDKTYDIVIKKPAVSYLLRVLLGIKKGAPSKVVAKLSHTDLILLARFKFPELNLFSACTLIRGTARSLGVRITKDIN